MELGLIWTIAGVIVTVLTFIIGSLITYKLTVGARKERAKAAYSEISKTLYRNLVFM